VNKRSLLNLVLLLVALALVAVVVYAPGDKKDTPVKLTSLDKTGVSRILITRHNQEDLLFEKHDGHWFISKPVHIDANPLRVEALLEILGTRSHTRFSAKGRDLQPFGLKQPLATLTIDNTRIEFGDTEPVNRRRYVMIGNTIHLITDSFYHQLKIELPSFVANQLFDSPIKSITLPRLSITKNPDDGWQITPQDKQVDTDKLQAFIDRWQTLQAERVERSDKTPASGNVKISLENGKDITLDIIKTASHTSLRRNDIGLQYRLFPNQVAALFSVAAK
jgi:hypothetical protein